MEGKGTNMGYLSPNPLAPFPSHKLLERLEFCRPWKGVANWEGHAPPATDNCDKVAIV